MAIKVRTSEIPVDSGKPIYEKDSIKVEKVKGDFFSFFKGEDEEEKKPPVLLHFKEEGLTIQAKKISGVKKVMVFKGGPISSAWFFGIKIFEGGKDTELWYASAEIRDENYDKILAFLAKEGIYNVIDI